MSVHLEIPHEDVTVFCRRWEIVEMALFGSVLRDDFGPDSDVDVLVRFDPKSRRTLFDMVTMQEELKEILGRETDLIERTAIERSRNYIRRKAILGSAEVIYAT